MTTRTREEIQSAKQRRLRGWLSVLVATLIASVVAFMFSTALLACDVDFPLVDWLAGWSATFGACSGFAIGVVAMEIDWDVE